MSAAVMSVTEAARLLKASPQTVYRLIREDQFPCPIAVVRIGGTLRISRPALDRWLAGEIDGQGHPVTGTEPTTTLPPLGGSPAVVSAATAGVRSHPR